MCPLHNYTSQLLLLKCDAVRSVTSKHKSLVELAGNLLKGGRHSCTYGSPFPSFPPLPIAWNRKIMLRNTVVLLRLGRWNPHTEMGDIWNIHSRLLVVVPSSLDCLKSGFLLCESLCADRSVIWVFYVQLNTIFNCSNNLKENVWRLMTICFYQEQFAAVW